MEKTLQAAVEKGWPKDHEDLKDLLIQNETCISLLKKGLSLDQCDFHIGRKQDYYFNKEVLPLLEAWQSGNLLLLEGRRHESRGKSAEVVDAYLSCLSFAAHLAQERSLASRTVGLRLEQRACRLIGEYLQSEKPARKTCRKISSFLDKHEQGRYPAKSFVEEEREVFLSMLQMLADEIDPEKGSDDEQRKKVMDFKAELLKQGRLLCGKYLALYDKAVESNREKDWKAASREIKRLKETVNPQRKDFWDEWNDTIENHSEKLDETLAREIVKITFLTSRVKLRPAVDQYYQTRYESERLKSLAQDIGQ
jgi:hypothetical protein